MERRQSGKGIVYSVIEVKQWAAEIPSVERARPACCSRCGAASRPLGVPIVVVGHGVRERQVRGPADAESEPEIRTILVRRYRCRLCGGITTVLPRGLVARRHYSASAIGLSFCLFGMQGLSVAETRRRICPWQAGFVTDCWTTLPNWVAAIERSALFSQVRPWPSSFSLRQKAERAAAALCGLSLKPGSIEARVFAGAALAA